MDERGGGGQAGPRTHTRALSDQTGRHMLHTCTVSDQTGCHVPNTHIHHDQVGCHMAQTRTVSDQARHHMAHTSTASDQVGHHVACTSSVGDQAGHHMACTSSLSDQPVLDLAFGLPDPDMLAVCVDIFRRVREAQLAEEPEGQPSLQGWKTGSQEYLEATADFLTEAYGEVVCRENMVTTAGATHGLRLATTLLLRRGGVVFVEDPTYFFALDMFCQDQNLRVIPVPLLEEGIDMDALESAVVEEIQRHPDVRDPDVRNPDARDPDVRDPDDRSTKLFWGMVYVVTAFQNPTGICYSSACCRRLVHVARQYNLLVVCDDVYNLLYYSQRDKPPSRLFTYDQASDPAFKGNVISNGSFSKIMCPRVRLGWMEVPPRIMTLLKQPGVRISEDMVSNYAAAIMASVIQQGHQGIYLRALVRQYKRRMEIACCKLQKYLPAGCSFHPPEGGCFIWVQLPSSVDVARFLPWCKEQYSVSANPGPRFSMTGSHRNYFRLSISCLSRDKLQTAVEALCAAVREYMRNCSEESLELRAEGVRNCEQQQTKMCERRRRNCNKRKKMSS